MKDERKVDLGEKKRPYARASASPTASLLSKPEEASDPLKEVVYT